jgi:glutaredoxin
MESCPYCKQAHKWIKELFDACPQYAEIPFKIIDEVKEPEIAAKYDYYYVPTYYVGDTKVHEGVASYDIIRNVFEEASKK